VCCSFAFGSTDEGAVNPHLPHNHVHNAVVYTGTHDNDTTAGWFKSIRPRERRYMRQYVCSTSNDPSKVTWDLVRVAQASVADTVIVPLQDLLGLGTEARMNLPGKPGGNWQWRFEAPDLTSDLAERTARLTRLYGRASEVKTAGSVVARAVRGAVERRAPERAPVLSYGQWQRIAASERSYTRFSAAILQYYENLDLLAPTEYRWPATHLRCCLNYTFPSSGVILRALGRILLVAIVSLLAVSLQFQSITHGSASQSSSPPKKPTPALQIVVSPNHINVGRDVILRVSVSAPGVKTVAARVSISGAGKPLQGSTTRGTVTFTVHAAVLGSATVQATARGFRPAALKVPIVPGSPASVVAIVRGISILVPHAKPQMGPWAATCLRTITR